MAYLFLSILFPGAIAIVVQFIKIRRMRFDKPIHDVDTFVFISERKADVTDKADRTIVRYISPRLKDAKADSFTCMN